MSAARPGGTTTTCTVKESFSRLRSARRAVGLIGTVKETRPALSGERTIRPTRVVAELRADSDDRFASRMTSSFPPALAWVSATEPRTEPPRWLFATFSAWEGLPWRGDSVDPGGGGGGVPPGGTSVELTVIVPFISVGWTGQMKE